MERSSASASSRLMYPSAMRCLAYSAMRTARSVPGSRSTASSARADRPVLTGNRVLPAYDGLEHRNSRLVLFHSRLSRSLSIWCSPLQLLCIPLKYPSIETTQQYERRRTSVCSLYRVDQHDALRE